MAAGGEEFKEMVGTRELTGSSGASKLVQGFTKDIAIEW